MELSNPRKSEPSGREPRPDMAAASLTPGKIRSKWDGDYEQGEFDAERESGGDDDGRVRHGSNGAERDKWKASGDPKTRSGLGTVKSVGFRRIRMFVTYWGRVDEVDRHLVFCCLGSWSQYCGLPFAYLIFRDCSCHCKF